MASKNKRLLKIGGLIAAAVLLLAAFASLRGSEVAVRAALARRENISNTISTNGKAEPVQNFEAHAPLATTVKRLAVHEGDSVRPGQLLLQLDDADARSQAARALAGLRAAEAALKAVHAGGTQEEVLTTRSELVKARTELDAARRNLEATRRLQQRGAASAVEVQEAENRLKRVQAQVNLLEQKQSARYSAAEVARVRAEQAEAQAAYAAAQDLLRQTNVRSSLAGTVYSLPVRQGAYVNPGDLLVQVADLTKMQVRAFVDEPEIGRLQQGLRVTIDWDALPGRTWEGTLTRVPTTVATRGTRTVGEITCHIENPDRKLLPNVNVNVVVTTVQHQNALTVPREAVRQDEEAGPRYVYEIVGEHLRRRQVQTGVSNAMRVEITSGLQDNSLVAIGTTGRGVLREGAPVRVVRQ